MKFDTSGIDTEQLARLVGAEYELDIASISFHPKGEASYSYVAVTRDGARYLVKVQETVDVANLESSLGAVNFVRTEGGLSQVLAPYRNRRGTFTSHHAHYTASVFPFIEGQTVWELGPSDEYGIRIAPVMAALHKSGRLLPFPVPAETFDNPFEAPILHALHTVETIDPQANDYQRHLRRLLLDERTDILATLDKMRRLKAELGGLDLDRALTHGDPNWANILVDTSNNLLLIDWEDVALGPPERDLMFFTDWGEGRFELFLRRYLETYGKVRLHEDAFAFYLYRWVVQEIADYSTRILFQNVYPEEDEHAWAELMLYLPTRHEDIDVSLCRIMEVVRRVSAA